MPVFKTGAINRSATSPQSADYSCRLSIIVRRIHSIYGTLAPQFISRIRDAAIKRAQSRDTRTFPGLLLLLPLQLVGQRSHAVDLPHSLDHPGGVNCDCAILCAVVNKVAGQ